MCRVAAIISGDKEDLLLRIEKMTKAMQHGGPDDAGAYVDDQFPVALGHRRLSIIDLSAAGHQPFFSNDGRLALSFNGEIYNYRELKAELQRAGYVFRSGSDTEVLLYAYDAWGVDCLPKLEGMFAFVLLDKSKQQVLAARDHAGIKPLYYGKKGGDLYFSSEVKGFLATDPGWPQNQQWPVWFLTFGFIPEPDTTLQNVWHLPKQHYLLYDLKQNNYTIQPYEQAVFTSEIISYEEAVRELRRSVEASVEKHLIADVPVGVFLSGGIDSSILTLAAQKKIPGQLKTLSVFFDDESYTEQRYQDIIVQKTGISHHGYKIKSAEFFECLPDIYKAMDQPSTDGVNSYFITKYAKADGFKVVLSGLGADELFGGYPSFRRTKYQQYARKMRMISHLIPLIGADYPRKKISFLKEERWYNDYLLNRGLFAPEDVAKILGIDTKKVIAELAAYAPPQQIHQLENRNRVSMLETDIYMQNQLLRDSDMYSMWHSIELRVPFLDKQLMQLARKIDPAVKFSGIPKQILIDAFKDELPEAIWNRPKQGFVFPFEKWFPVMPAFGNNRYIPPYWRKKFEKKKLNYSRIWSIFISRTYASPAPVDFEKGNEPADTLFMYLSAFSQTGGIEKVNKSLLKVLDEKTASGTVTEAYSVYDGTADTRYFPRYMFKGFSGHRIRFMLQLLLKPIPWDHVIVGHINLASAARLLQMRKKSLRVTVMTHGIEVWMQLKGSKKQLLENADHIIAVSNFTKDNILRFNNVPASRISVCHNCLDPFFTPIVSDRRPDYLLKRYGLKPSDKVLLTIARLKTGEQYKGYDNVIRTLSALPADVKYILVGNADETEKQRVMMLMEQEGVADRVFLTGFVPDDEIIDHYRIADVFVMPSKREGFGIVFIEAAACGIQVVAGNTDGSAEAVMNGKIGKLVSPDDKDAITGAIEETLSSYINKTELSHLVLDKFGFTTYKQQIKL